MKTYSEKALELLEPDIDYWCKRYYVNGYDIEDLKQEVKMKVWIKLQTFKTDKYVLLRTWGNSIIRNCLINLLRDSKTQKRGKKTVPFLDIYYKEQEDLGDLIDITTELNLNLEDFL